MTIQLLKLKLNKNSKIKTNSKTNKQIKSARGQYFKRFAPFANDRRLDLFLSKFPAQLNCVSGVDQEKITPLVYAYNDIFRRYYEHKGLVWTLRFLKDLYGVAMRFAASHQFEPLPYCRTDSAGLPVVLAPYRALLRGNVEERRTVLSVLQLFKLRIVENPDYNLNGIMGIHEFSKSWFISSYPGQFFEFNSNSIDLPLKWKDRWINCWKKELEICFPADQQQQRLENVRRRSSLHVSGKSGPNGHAVGSVLFDNLSIRRDPALYRSVREVSRITGNLKLTQILDSFEKEVPSNIETNTEHQPIHSKFSLKHEPGAKVRVFAIVDYFTQSALSGMNDYLFDLLNKIQEDGTFDQDRATDFIQEWTRSDLKIYSKDLTEATNLLPVELLREIVACMFGEDLARHWACLMANREFNRLDGKGKVQYGTGQPMGSKTSWAMLDLWHHLIIRTCFRFQGSPIVYPFDQTAREIKYLVLGDDSAFIGGVTANIYCRAVQMFCGMAISESKGFGPDNLIPDLNPLDLESPSSAEFAKRVFVGGEELTPASPSLFREASEYPSGLGALLRETWRRNYPSNSTSPKVLTLSNLSFKPKLALIEASFPEWPAPQLNAEGDRANLSDEALAYLQSATFHWSKIPRGELAKQTRLVISDMLNDKVSETQSRKMMLIMNGAEDLTFFDGSELFPISSSLIVDDFIECIDDIGTHTIIERSDRTKLSQDGSPVYFRNRLTRNSIRQIMSFNDMFSLLDNDKSLQRKESTRLSRILNQITQRIG
jgi:hypothetical protein